MSGTTVPSLSVYTPGQSVFSASWANGVMQGGAFLANLRTFIGIPNMTVQLIGFIAQGDGGQGTFVWSPSPGTDDGGVTCVVPYGVTQGCWLRQLPGYVLPASQFTVVSPLVAPILNVAALRLITSTTVTANQIILQGYFSGADGGGGLFWYNPSDTASVDNGGTIFVDASSRRWYRINADAALSLDWFGGTSTTTDCAAAMNAALAVLPEPGGTIVIPGVRRFASGITYTYPSGTFSLTIVGIGANSSAMVFGGTNGLALNGNSSFHTFHMRDIAIETSGILGGFIGVSLSNSIQGGLFGQSDFTRVSFQGTDGGGVTNCWTTAIQIVGWGNFTYETCLFYGNSTANGTNGLSLAGNAAGEFKYSLTHNLNNCGFFNLGIGVSYGTYVQGVQITNCNFTNGTTDIFSPTGTVSDAQLAVCNSQFAGLGSRIVLNGQMACILLTNNLIRVAANQIGLALNALYGQVAITGNVFSGQSVTGSFGIVAAAQGYTAICTGNAFYGLAAGINLQGATTGGWIVALNNYGGSTTNVENIGSNSVGVISP